MAGASIVELSDLCAPAPFCSALEQIAKMNGGAVTSTVQNVAHVLRKLAKYSGALTPEEVAKVEEAYANLRHRFTDRKFPRMDRDQKVLELDDARMLDAFLSVARRRVAAIRRSCKVNKRSAVQIQLALALELSLCAPLRIKNLVSLNLDRHFFTVTLNGEQQLVIRIAGEETKTGEPTEHIVFEDARELLRLYVDEYRPLTSASPGDWLFPGAKGGHKTENTLGTQLTRWISAELGIAFHPHLVRKIVTELYADLDPGGLEVMRRMLGHRSDAMLRKTYMQKAHRASQRKYSEALESRRLSAFGLARIGRTKRGLRG